MSLGKKGTILFSIGSIFQGEDLSEDILNKFIEAFRDLSEYQILWKFESDKLNGRVSSNVMIRSWLPQNDLLADKRVKVFISHAGMLSTHEAIYHGVPVLAVPLLSDQHRVSGRVLIMTSVYIVSTRRDIMYNEIKTFRQMCVLVTNQVHCCDNGHSKQSHNDNKN